MNPGPLEEAGKAAGSVIDAMKTQPLALALVIMNCALLGLFFFVTSTVAKQREREITMLYAEHKEVRELLSRCTAPAHKETAS
jgi:hypothetical protein